MGGSYEYRVYAGAGPRDLREAERRQQQLAVQVAAGARVERGSAVGGSRTMTRFVLAIVAAAFIVLKFVLHIHFSGVLSFAWGFYLAIILTAGLVYLALQARRAPDVPAARPPVGSAGPPPAGPPVA